MPVAAAASASSWSTTCWYSTACSRVSPAQATCSILSGRSGTSERSAFVRRSTNGWVIRRSRAAASPSPSRSIGLAKRCRNRSRLPSIPGLTTSRIAHRSARRFSTGVPVRASFWPARRARIALAAWVAGFLIICASSATTVDHSTAPRCSRSRGSSPYVVMTRSAPASSCSARSAPWWTTTRSAGAKRPASACQLWTTDSGHTTRCGPGRSRRWASVVAVLPRPMSSARQPPRPRRSRKRSQARPRRWYGRSSPTNARRLVLLLQAIVGEPGQQLVGPRRHPWPSRSPTATGVQLALARQLQQRHGVDERVLADVVLQSLAGPPHGRRVDAHPASPAVQQRGASPLGPLQLGVADRRRAVVVGDDQLPVDDRLAPEALRVVGRVLRRGPAARPAPRPAPAARGRPARCRGRPARPVPARGSVRRPRRPARVRPARARGRGRRRRRCTRRRSSPGR